MEEWYEDGDPCTEDECDGILEFVQPFDCTCHIIPPCASCMEAPLTCNKFGHEIRPEQSRRDDND